MSMPILHTFPPCPPCRAVRLLAKCIDLELDLKSVNVLAGEQMKPEYLKVNPKHTIPTLEDGDLVISESRPIMTYLVSAYAKDDSLYPKDPRARAVVDYMLYFDIGTLYARFPQCYFPAIFDGGVIEDAKLEKLHEAVGYLETMIEGKEWLAGNTITVADIAIVVSISNLDAFGFDLSSYPNISAWYEKTKRALMSYGYEEINQAGADMFGGMFRSRTAS